MLVNLVTWIFGPQTTADSEISGSTYSNAPTGMRALALMYERFGYEVVQRRSDFTDMSDLDRDLDLIYISCAFEKFEPDEIANLKAWLNDGGKLIVIEPAASDLSRELLPGLEARTAGPTSSVHLQRNPVDVNSCAYPLNEDGAPAQISTGRPVALSPALVGVTEVVMPQSLIFDRFGEAIPLAMTSDGAAAVSSHGHGGSLVVISANPFVNSIISNLDNAQLALNFARQSRRIVFDEYHLGFRKAGGSILAMPVQWRWALLGLLLALVAYVWARAPRKSATAEEPRVLPRSRAEFVDALARSLEKADGAEAAVAILQDDLRKRLRQRLFLQEQLTDQQLANASAVLGIDSSLVANALRPISRDTKSFVERVRLIGAVRKELRCSN